MRRALLVLLAAVVVTAAAVVVGVLVTRDGEEPAAAPPPYTSTPLADYDTTYTAVQRTLFCDAVPAEAAAEALGVADSSGSSADAPETGSYANGDRARMLPRVQDVAHEFGCTWRSGGATARAWVFAPPVSPGRARELVESVRSESDCTVPDDAAAFGSPSLALVCDTPKGRQASFRGLFGDAWLTCSVVVRAQPEEALDRAGRWCVAVAQAASGTR